MKKLLVLLFILSLSISAYGETKKLVYETSQTDAVLLSVSSSKSLFVWNCWLENTEDGLTFIKYETSEDTVLEFDGIGGGIHQVNLFGAIDENIIITCPANTTVVVLFDEI